MYEKDLAEQLKCETSGHFESLLMDLCKVRANHISLVPVHFRERVFIFFIRMTEMKATTWTRSWRRKMQRSCLRQVLLIICHIDSIADAIFFLSLNSFLPKECLSKLGIAVLGRRRQMGHRRRRLHQNYRKSKSETASSDIRRIREGTWNNGSRIRIFRK